MPKRRAFLASIGLSSIGCLRSTQVFARPFRRRRYCTPANPPAPIKQLSVAAQSSDVVIQPNYELWRQLKAGMSEADVIGLLGEPLERDTEESVIESLMADGFTRAEAINDLRSFGDTYVFQWVYGRLKFSSQAMPREFGFHASFMQGRLDSIRDPFGGRLSVDGKPTIPVPFLPANNATFNHFPRFLDLRWVPSSGEYPMSYDIEIEFASPVVDDMGNIRIEHHVNANLHSQIPYAAATFVGKNTGRWRVRAENRLGQSEWSLYRHFKFEV